MSDTEKKGWFTRLKDGLKKSTSSVSDGISGLFTTGILSGKRKLDAETLDELEDVLIMADFGVVTAAKVTEELGRTRLDKEVSSEEIRRTLASVVARTLAPVAKPLVIDPANRPHVILVVGVNGSGKTTTIGKLARQFRAQGKSVMLAAGDTFRAAAIEQLAVWGERNNVPVIAKPVGSDAAAVAYEALDAARAANVDVLMIDTAGRLQNKQGLMEELAKVVRVIRKYDPSAPHDTLLVLDATTGQNAVQQVDVFRSVAQVTGLIMTKLDGTARGGVLVACAERFKLPIHAIGVGESIEDLQPFDANEFANTIAGVAS
ncbi:signal recognition particle-docking protein FtsY [Iodidimonas sp. SYSU 1G8]|uniref:signal recognition particle-docking protein FtsY n=1 Tax=Iodidimonas sp. SYSU 1G8 TaxID=3133967 RepID=UPI0031FED173